MEITWLGHSSFQLKSSGVSLITDPFQTTVGFSFPDLSAQIVTVSNSHPHHNDWGSIGDHPRVLDGPGEYEIGGVFIDGLRTSPLRLGTTLNTAYLIEMEGLTLCHLGDLMEIPSGRTAEQLRVAEILFIPVGGHCTLSPKEAVEVVNQLEPRMVIPMHFWTEGNTVDLDPVDVFLRELGKGEAVSHGRINVTPATLPRELQVVVPERLI